MQKYDLLKDFLQRLIFLICPAIETMKRRPVHNLVCVFAQRFCVRKSKNNNIVLQIN